MEYHEPQLIGDIMRQMGITELCMKQGSDSITKLRNALGLLNDCAE